jgi:glutathione S-transferase
MSELRIPNLPGPNLPGPNPPELHPSSSNPLRSNLPGSKDRILYEFPHSHFCEVARWGLDYKGLSYTRQAVLPGYHAYKIKKLAPKTHVPLLYDNGIVVQGSGAILDHLQTNYPERSINADLSQAQINAAELDIAQAIGVPLRRLCYAHLLDKPALVRYFFMHRSSWFEKLIFRAAYPILKARIRDTYDCTERGAESAQRELASALDRYDDMLSTKKYLGGGVFSRLDITFASLAVFMVMPKQYPVQWPAALKTMELSDWFTAQASRPSYQHVQALYNERYAIGE